jgi:hypothetical protein
MGLTGYFRSVRVARIATLVLGGTLVAAAIPAEARLSHPTIGGPISDGFFQGMPVRVEASGSPERVGTDRRRGRQLLCTTAGCT